MPTKLINSEELLGVLQGFNPWWRNGAFTVPQFRRLAYYACQKYANDSSIRRAILISGPRRVGKTTILLQTAFDLLKEGVPAQSILYLSLDHPILKLAGLSEVLRVYHEIIQQEDLPCAAAWDAHSPESRSPCARAGGSRRKWPR